MRIAVLKEGAIVVKEGDQQWLFGVPENIQNVLKEEGIEQPKVVFTTNLRAPGLGHLGPVLTFKEKPLRMNGLSATPIEHKHGTDFAIKSDNGTILYSERGDVSVEDVEGYHLAIIKNKHRADEFSETVLTWPWKSQEFILTDNLLTPVHAEVTYKVWTSVEDVPENIKKVDNAPLSLEQSNWIARVAKGAGEEGKENWAIAISSFKKAHMLKDGKWVKKEEETAEKEHGMMTLLSQDKAGYKAKGSGIKVCANCEYYCKNMTCKKVEGEISPMGTCDIWEYGVEEKMPMTTYMGELKEYPQLIPGLPSEIDNKGWKTTYKDGDTDRWLSISSVAAWDRQNELFSTKAMDWAIAFGNMINYKGPLRYRHIPGLDGGDCDTQVRVGDFLFESGTFRDNALGQKLKELMLDPEYGVSIGLAFAKGDLEPNGMYKRAAIFERSMTKQPSVITTSIIRTKEDNLMKILTETELKSVAEELGFPVEEVKLMYERALTAGGPFGLKEFKEFALKEGGGSVVVTGDSEDDEPEKSELTTKEMFEILKELGEDEFETLKFMVERITKAKKSDYSEEDMEDDEEEMEVEVKMPMKKKKSSDDRLSDLENLFTQQSQLIMEQTKSINTLAQALTGTQNDTNKAIQNFMGQLPRKQAANFVSTSTKEQEPSSTDAQILAKLKELEGKLNSGTQAPGMKAVYDVFTSKNLNQGR